MYRSYLNPAIARKSFPKNTNEYALASLSIRRLWHTIYDHCPKLLELCPPDGKKLLDEFLQYADDNSLSMNWTMHLHLLSWLNQHKIWREKIDNSIKEELMIASALRWGRGNSDDVNEIKKHSMAIYVPCLEGKAVGIKRSDIPLNNSSVFILKSMGDNLPKHISYCLPELINQWNLDNWNSIPK